MSRSVLILLILTILWIILGVWLCRTNLEDKASSDHGPCGGDWSLEYNGNTFEADGYIGFPKSKDTHKATSTSINGMLDKLATFLKKNKSENLTILGYFDEGESYGDKDLVYLGLARANDVKKMLTKRGVPASQLSVKPMKWETDCFENGTLMRGAEFSFGK